MPYLHYLYEVASGLRHHDVWFGLMLAAGSAIEAGVSTPIDLGVHLLRFGVDGDVVAVQVVAAEQDERARREAA